jgi:hypothetical protein
MDFTVTDLTRCVGQNHYFITATIGGQSYVIETTLQEVQLDFSDMTSAEVRTRIIDRCRSAKKEANAVTFTQTRTALLNNTYKL